MPAKPPSEESLRLKTERLVLEPILRSHAREMADLLKDVELYKFIPQNPPDLSQLEKKYEIWGNRISPDGGELWLNWAARLTRTGEVIGHFQAGVKAGAKSSLGYTVGVKFQRQGLAREALRAIFNFLHSKLGLKSAKALIDTRNMASIKLVENLGMTKVDVLKKADHFKGTDSDEFIYEISLDKFF